MIGWSAQAPVLKSLLGTLATDTSLVVEPVDEIGGTRTFAAEWHEGRRGIVHDKQKMSLTLRINVVAGTGGEDELRRVHAMGGVEQTGPGSELVATGTPVQLADGTIAIVDGGELGVATADWSYGGEAESGVPLTSPFVLGTTGVTMTMEDVPSFVEDTLYEFSGQLREAMEGERRITLQVQSHVIGREDGMLAFTPLERIRARLGRTSSRAALLAADMVVEEVLAARKATYKDDSRVVQSALMDIMLRCTFTDLDPVAAGWIESIELSSHLRTGDELPPSLQMVDEILPEGAYTP